jgi:TonB family protein
MKTLEFWIAVYVLNSLWQLPLVFAAAWIAARLVRPAGPRIEHRVWVAAVVIGTVLPACHLDMNSFWQRAWEFVVWCIGGNATGGSTRVILGPAVTSGSGVLRLPAYLVVGVLCGYGACLLYFTSRLVWGLYRTGLMPRKAEPLPPGNNLCERIPKLGIPAAPPSVHLATSPWISGPVTIGVWRCVLLLPPGFLERVGEADLDAMLAHEFAHMRRRDFTKNLIYGVLSLPVAYHPALWLSCARLAETREMICDEIAAEAVTGRESYARSLLRLASILTGQMPAKTLHAIGIFDANIFERRIMNLTQKRGEIRIANRFAIVVACLLVAIVTCASAFALRMDLAPASAQNDPPKKIHVKADSLKLISHADPVFPPDAKVAGTEGSVVLDVLISKEGVPEHISIQKGPLAFQKSALNAVRQWRWQSFLLNGNPIEVETSVTVVFTLKK